MTITRRQFGKLSALALLAPSLAALPKISLAANPTGKKLHGLSAFGDLPLAEDYRSFAYTNPKAPKGGTFNFGISDWMFNQNPQSFDTLNSFVLKGAAPPRIEHCFDSLMTEDWDDASAIYGRLASSVKISEDRNSYTYYLRPEARWHDGAALTAHDVAFTYLLYKKDGHPNISLNLTHLVDAIAIDDHTVVLIFNGNQSDRVILENSILPIQSKIYYETHDFLATTMESPLTSGLYRVGKLEPGTFIEYERVTDYWAKGLPFAQGSANFDILRIEFYRERQAAFEAFKKGKINYREEFTSKIWATEYNFPAMKEKRARKELFADEPIPALQGWACNTRRQKLSNPLTRQAIGLCFDFEWTNANFFYEAYTRSSSFFENSPFVATGTPSPEELVHLEPFRLQVDAGVFGDAITQPVSDGSGRDRTMLRQASRLFAKAGWKRDGKLLVDEDGTPFTLEFLIRSPTFERILGKFVSNLKALGVQATIRLVDPSQYQKRLDDYDFDITGTARVFGALPTGDTLKQLFGSTSADTPGAPNMAGIKEPAVDALIAKISATENLEDLTILLRALDRVLRSTHSWIPNWYSANHRVAYWDMFGVPDRKPTYKFYPELHWWFDEDKAKAIGKA